MTRLLVLALLLASTAQAKLRTVGGQDPSKLPLAGGTLTGATGITNQAFTATGANGNIVSAASVTASGLFGDASAVTGITQSQVAGLLTTSSPTFGGITISSYASIGGAGANNGAALEVVGISSATKFRGVGGTQGAPTYAAGTTNAGFYCSQTGGTCNIATGGTSRVFWDSNGTSGFHTGVNPTKTSLGYRLDNADLKTGMTGDNVTQGNLYLLSSGTVVAVISSTGGTHSGDMIGAGNITVLAQSSTTFLGPITASSMAVIGVYVSTQAAGAAGASVTALCKTAAQPAGTTFALGGGCSCSGAVGETANISIPNVVITGGIASGWTCQITGGTGGACSAYVICSRAQ